MSHALSLSHRCGGWLLSALMLVCVTLGAQAAEPAPATETARYEVAFIEDMIDHHAMAVHMATMCEEKAVHEDLAALCAEMRAAQQQEIESMQAWLQDWYGVSHAPVMKRGHEREMAKLAALSPEQFEIAFMEMMIKHHAGAIREGSRCLERAYHDALLDLCAGIIETQAMEIQLMRSWLCEWYAICRE